MNLLSKLSSIFRPESAGLVCPRCDRELEGHDEDRCDRMASRRYFLQAIIGAAVAAPLLPNVHIGVDLASGPALNSVLMTKWLAEESLRILQRNLTFSRYMNRSYNDEFMPRIGDTINVRRPSLFLNT